MFILVLPKYKAEAFLPLTGSVPSSLGGPSFSVAALRSDMALEIFGSFWAKTEVGIQAVATIRNPAVNALAIKRLLNILPSPNSLFGVEVITWVLLES
ncbi:MAG: hypothetical protein P4M15_02190 [Alphaproteobacteria bacterium]|nr:hypothetical protein [Alphaproteobacteria bacterium]